MKYVAGIDGGQTTTAAVIADERGCVVGRGIAGPADEVGQGADSTRMHDALSGALRAACNEAGLGAGAHFETIVAGASGYEGRVYGKMPELPATRFVLMHDAPVAHAGALGGEPGIVIIAGTGSVVYATDGKEGWTLGGWGYLFGDEGSGFWFARERLAALMSSEDVGIRSPDKVRRACEFFGQPSLRAIARAFYSGEITRDRLAAFGSVDLLDGDSWSDATLAGTKFSWLVRESILRGAPPRVALVGGMFNDEDFAATVRKQITQTHPNAEVVSPRYDPAVGALILAYREAGISGIEIAS